MNKNIKLAIAALLGFSTACSSVKSSPAKGDDPVKDGPDSVRVDIRPVVMYGVRMPDGRMAVPVEEVVGVDRSKADSTAAASPAPTAADSITTITDSVKIPDGR